MTIVTPAAVERRLVDLSKELDEANDQLVAAEHEYMRAKSAWEINGARARLGLKAKAADQGQKMTVQDVEDAAILQCETYLTAYNASEAVVRSARANIVRVRTQIDIARSVGTSVRSSMEIA
jgi:hypothetical protein